MCNSRQELQGKIIRSIAEGVKQPEALLQQLLTNYIRSNARSLVSFTGPCAEKLEVKLARRFLSKLTEAVDGCPVANLIQVLNYYSKSHQLPADFKSMFGVFFSIYEIYAVQLHSSLLNQLVLTDVWNDYLFTHLDTLLKEISSHGLVRKVNGLNRLACYAEWLPPEQRKPITDLIHGYLTEEIAQDEETELSLYHLVVSLKSWVPEEQRSPIIQGLVKRFEKYNGRIRSGALEVIVELKDWVEEAQLDTLIQQCRNELHSILIRRRESGCESLTRLLPYIPEKQDAVLFNAVSKCVNDKVNVVSMSAIMLLAEIGKRMPFDACDRLLSYVMQVLKSPQYDLKIAGCVAAGRLFSLPSDKLQPIIDILIDLMNQSATCPAASIALSKLANLLTQDQLTAYVEKMTDIASNGSATEELRFSAIVALGHLMAFPSLGYMNDHVHLNLSILNDKNNASDLRKMALENIINASLFIDQALRQKMAYDFLALARDADEDEGLICLILPILHQFKSVLLSDEVDDYIRMLLNQLTDHDYPSLQSKSCDALGMLSLFVDGDLRAKVIDVLISLITEKHMRYSVYDALMQYREFMTNSQKIAVLAAAQRQSDEDEAKVLFISIYSEYRREVAVANLRAVKLSIDEVLNDDCTHLIFKYSG